ncbi:MAG: hypothetical protein KA758_02690 [Acidimicrobiales bacterium]|nr:hypothetical protein [Acidimicrobiales bacterium]
MSCYEWERGTLKLPTAEFSKLRKKLEDSDRSLKEQVFDHSQKFWKALPAAIKTKKPADGAWNVEFHKALDDYCAGLGGLAEPVRNQVGRCGWGERPRRVLKSEMNFPTNRTTSFDVDGGEASITFDRASSSVTWSVMENNHAVETARTDPLARVFFRELGKINWTRGTGGVIVGNNEYNHGDGVGDGANYIVEGFGPLGKSRGAYFGL